MFQSEMDNLELGLSLGSSDLLFPDDLFNVPLDLHEQQQQQNGLKTSTSSLAFTGLGEEGGEQQQQEPDLLQKVIEEIKMAPMEIKVESTATPASLDDNDTEMKSILADYNDLLFEEPPALSPSAASSAGGSSSSSMGEEDDTQNLIDEMEEFLSSHETASPNEEAPKKLEKTTLTASETRQAEEIVEALVSGDLSLDRYSQEQQDRLARESGLAPGAIGATISNISEIITEDGKKIVIVIANDDKASQRQLPNPQPGPSSPSQASSSSGEEEEEGGDVSDPEWMPESPQRQQPSKRKAAKALSSIASKGVSSGRVSRRSSAKQYNVRDKKERKKLQNVVAARRYRDKKKNEQQEMEQEEQELEERNEELRAKVAEAESELKTLKKLMVELGLVKVSAATAKALRE